MSNRETKKECSVYLDHICTDLTSRNKTFSVTNIK
uniref:Uncharacterized protein n=1 Tax=Rhizophora mucronata TaxID=61149 RepID=A0A2P2P0J1_RHIMU